jgi:GR25 family glycosyltransferase involved in LPS biosynthesis
METLFHNEKCLNLPKNILNRVEAVENRSNPDLGRYQSHLKAIETALVFNRTNPGQSYFLICEDDIVFRNDLRSLDFVLRWTRENPREWNIVNMSPFSSESRLFKNATRINKVIGLPTGQINSSFLDPLLLNPVINEEQQDFSVYRTRSVEGLSCYLVNVDYLANMVILLRNVIKEFSASNRYQDMLDIAWKRNQLSERWITVLPQIAIQVSNMSDIMGSNISYFSNYSMGFNAPNGRSIRIGNFETEKQVNNGKINERDWMMNIMCLNGRINDKPVNRLAREIEDKNEDKNGFTFVLTAGVWQKIAIRPETNLKDLEARTNRDISIMRMRRLPVPPKPSLPSSLGFSVVKPTMNYETFYKLNESNNQEQNIHPLEAFGEWVVSLDKNRDGKIDDEWLNNPSVMNRVHEIAETFYNNNNNN